MSIVTTMKELMKNINMIPELCAKLADVEKNVDSHTIALQKLHQALQEETKKQTETLQGMSQEIAGVGTNVDASAAQIMVQGSEKAEELQQVLSALHASQAKGVEDLRTSLEETARKQAEALQGISGDMAGVNAKIDASAAQIMAKGDVKADELQKMLSTIDASHLSGLQDIRHFQEDAAQQQAHLLQDVRTQVAGVSVKLDAAVEQTMVQRTEETRVLKEALSAVDTNQTKGVERVRIFLEETARKQTEALQGISSEMAGMNAKMDASAAQIITQGAAKVDGLQQMLSTMEASHLSGLQDVRHFQEDVAQQQSHLIQDVRTHVAGVSAKLDAAVEQMITQRTEENDVLKETLSALNTSQTNGVENVRTILEETAQKQAETLQEMQTYMSSLRSKMDSSITISSTNEEKLKRIHEEICTMDNAAKLILLGAVMSELDDVNSVTSKSE